MGCGFGEAARVAGLLCTGDDEHLTDTIARLRPYQEAAADVLYAPGLVRVEEIREVVASVDLPVNVLARRGAPTVSG